MEEVQNIASSSSEQQPADWNDISKENSIRLIQYDIPRTFPELMVCLSISQM